MFGVLFPINLNFKYNIHTHTHKKKKKKKKKKSYHHPRLFSNSEIFTGLSKFDLQSFDYMIHNATSKFTLQQSTRTEESACDGYAATKNTF